MYDEIALKLDKLKEKYNLTMTELGDIAGIKASNMSNFLNRKNQISINLEAMMRLSKYFGFKLDDLLSKSVEELEIIKNTCPSQTDDMVKNYDFIKFYNIKVSAGYGIDTDDEEKSLLMPVEKDFIRQIGYPKEDLSFVAVEGDSMEPTLRNGDRVIVYIPKGPISFVPSIYVIRDTTGVKVKRLDNDKDGSLMVSSDNKFYHTKIYSPDEVNTGNVTIIGRVVGKIGVM